MIHTPCSAHSSQLVEEVQRLLNKTLQNPLISRDARMTENFRTLLERSQDKSFRIAVVGEFSSGKSSLLNGLLGEDILKHGTRETTAAITMIRNVAMNDERLGTAIVTYSDGHTESILPREDMLRFTTTQSDLMVSSDIEQVEIFWHLFDTDRDIVFVDTPGLNGVADKHRERTLELVSRAHSCIYMLPREGLGKTDVDSLNELSIQQSDFIIVQSFLDILNASEGETPETKLTEQNDRLQEKLKDTHIRYQLCGVSSLLALKARTPSLSERQRNELYTQSHFGEFLSCLKALVDDNQLTLRQNRGILYSASEQLGILIACSKNCMDNVLDPERKKIEHAEEKYEKQKKLLAENEQKLRNFITSEFYKISRLITGKDRERRDNMLSELDQRVKAVKTITEMDSLMDKNGLAKLVNTKTRMVFEQLGQDCEILIGQVYQSALARISEYVMKDVTAAEYRSYITPDMPAARPVLDLDDATLRQIERSIERSEEKQKELDRELASRKHDQSRTQTELSNARRAMQGVELTHEQQLKTLGGKPEAEWVPDRYERRGWWIFKHDVLVREGYFDHSGQQRWENKKTEIERQFKESSAIYSAEISKCSAAFARIEKEIRQLESDRSTNDRFLELHRERKKTKLKNIELERDKLSGEFIRSWKSSVLSSISEYVSFLEEPHAKRIKEIMALNECRLTEEVCSIYSVSMNHYLQLLAEQLNGVGRDYKQLEQDIQSAEQIKKEMEKLLCLPEQQ